MKVRIIGIADSTINVDKEAYFKAKEDKRLHDFMDPYIKRLEMQVTYGAAEEFN